MKDILYIQKLRNLLQQEYDAEKEEYRRQMEEMGLERRIRRGLCWWPVKAGRSYYNSLNQLVVEIEKSLTPHPTLQNERGSKYVSSDDIEHCFEYGKPVVFFTTDNRDSTTENRTSKATSNATRYIKQTCQISFAEENRMVVVVGSSKMAEELQAAENLGVQLFFDETSYKTMFHALEEVMKDKKSRVSHLRSVFSGSVKPETWSFGAMKFPWLNPSQEKAVNDVLRAKDVAIVHGPPGTGKTTTMVEAIYETLRRETQVMVCAQSNMAVDWISERLVDHGVPVLRIGNPTRVDDKMLSFTYERKFEAHPDYPELWNLRRTIRQIKENRKRGQDIHQKISRLRDRAEEIEYRIKAELFSEARVIACTLVGADNRLLIGQKFPTLFIDEAAQAMEPACWIAIRRAGRVIFAGDHKQLPPTIKCYDALKGGLGVTLMERIVENVPQCVTMLKMQYRMHEDIMRFSSHWFYDDCVESAPSVKFRSILDYDRAIELVDYSELSKPSNPSEVSKPSNPSEASEPLEPSDSPELPDFREQFVGETHGRINKAEAELTIKTLENYVERIGKQRFQEERMDVGVISPYRLQIQYLRSLVKKSQILKPFRQQITVNTIDGFQGQERDVILISLVRSNEKGEIGFLNDLRRMNVAMTRARMKLFIIGNVDTLSHNPFYRDLIEYVKKLIANR